MRDSGRIRGIVNVTGNSGNEGVTSMRMYSSAQPSSTESYSESYSGYVTATTAAPIQPMPALPDTNVYGSAILRKTKTGGGECSITVSLPTQSVAVPVSGIVNAIWPIDMTQLTCPPPSEPPKIGSIQGNVTLSGLGGQNSDAFSSQRVYASNRSSNSLSGTIGSYSISAVPVGNHITILRSYFKSPYNSYLNFSSGSVSVKAGLTTPYDISKSVGTLHGAINPNGIWGMSDVNSMYARFTGTASTYDYADLTTGQFDLVTPVGNEYLHYLRPHFYANNGSRTFSQYYYRYYNSTTSPIQATVAVGDRLTGLDFDIETSAIDQGIYLAKPGVGIKRLDIQGKDYDPVTKTVIGHKVINLTSNLTGSSVVPTNGVIVPIYGEPGNYKMTAVADGDDGGTYRKEFTLELMVSQCTDANDPTQLHFSTGTGDSIGSVAFDTASCSTTKGCTAINVSNIGPRPPANFKVFSNQGQNAGNSAEYYDIRSTINFCDATVCFDYDDSQFNGNVQKEKKLKLAHYDSGTSTWDIISDNAPAPNPDTVNNIICGPTTGFSIFAILEPLDKDDDGILDSVDNCPETANQNQEDLDQDGYGDVCDEDIDGDEITNDEDNCPLSANENQADFDSDGKGDVCDDYIDIDIHTTGLIINKNYQAYVAQFKMTGMTDIGTAAKNAAENETPLTFQFGPEDETPIYSFTAENIDAAGNRLVYSDSDGNMMRCIFSTERCVVNIKNVDLDGDALDTLLTGEMTVTLEIDGTKYSNSGTWIQFDSNSGWIKYRKDN
ncbi:MAG: hypothetical protein D3923_00485 [Candidatus Electrothrix sp. AR3]|nr:hypothetical protein [Candidatus Electrothrix sp. AR3]